MVIDEQKERENLKAYIRDYGEQGRDRKEAWILASALIRAGRDRVADIPGWTCGTYISRKRETLTQILDDMIKKGNHTKEEVRALIDACEVGALDENQERALTELHRMIPNIHVNYSDIRAKYAALLAQDPREGS